VFEAVDWLADLPQQTWPLAAGRSSDVILTTFCWSQQLQCWRRPWLLGIVRQLQLRWLARWLWVWLINIALGIGGELMSVG